jgi:hypothetical protein
MVTSVRPLRVGFDDPELAGEKHRVTILVGWRMLNWKGIWV